MTRNVDPSEPRLFPVFACLLGGAAIAALFYGPAPLIVAVIGLTVAAIVIYRWSG